MGQGNDRDLSGLDLRCLDADWAVQFTTSDSRCSSIDLCDGCSSPIRFGQITFQISIDCTPLQPNYNALSEPDDDSSMDAH